MTINLSQLYIVNAKRELKRFQSQHAFHTALVMAFGIFYEELDRKLEGLDNEKL